MNFSYYIHCQLGCPCVDVKYPNIVNKLELEMVKNSLPIKCNMYVKNDVLSIWLSTPCFYTTISEVLQNDTVKISLEDFKKLITFAYENRE